MKKYVIAAVLSVSTLLSGCGFHLRSGPSLPDNINTVAIDSARAHAPLARALDNHLNVYGLNSVDKSAQSATATANNIHIYLYILKLLHRLPLM